ncbi:MAG: CDGSH iron-sulfur domain-containing protein [Prevotellaceae bacterium]|nr:CDGSH iron-sulfur domain-containing protein [Prevotellaceae bacterium]
MVHGNFTFKNMDGTLIDRKNITAFCRCGLSKNQPYCDGSHKLKSVGK